MRLLLDTHTAIWALTAIERLGDRVQYLIGDPSNQVCVSATSILEIALKHTTGKVADLPFSAGDAVRHFRAAGYILLDVTPDTAAAVETLPLIHRDPFDRLIVAQALTTPLRLVTHDRTVARYSDTIITF